MPILTLTSDIGQQDFLTGAVKGQLLQASDLFSLVDISHQISPFNYPQAAYVCRNAIKNFPAGTFHLILVNLFDEKPEHMLIAEHNGHYIGCGDNGLLTMILEEIPQKVVALDLEKSQTKNTLYCTTVFAKAFNDIANGKTLDQIGDPSVSIQMLKKVKNWHYLIQQTILKLLSTKEMQLAFLVCKGFQKNKIKRNTNTSITASFTKQ